MEPRERIRAALRVFGGIFHGILRAIGWTFLALVLLTAGAGSYLYRRFSPEEARRMAAEQLTALVHREVTIDHLVLSPRGLKVVGLRVRRGAGPDDGDTLVCDSALVTVKLKPLLSRRLEFDTVVLQSPQISLSRDADGNWNLADIFGSTAAAVGKPAALPVALASAETVVQDGVLRVTDHMHGRKLVFEKLALRVDAFDQNKPFPISASFRMSDTVGGRSVSAEASASGQINLADFHWSSATARADALNVEVEGVPFKGRAAVTGFSSPHIEAELSAPALGAEDWRHLLGRPVELSLPESRWTLKAELPAPAMLDVQKLTVETSAGAASAVGLFDFAAATPTLSVEVTARDADLSKAGLWSPAWAKHAPSGRASLRAAVTGWAGRLQAREAEVNLRGFGGTWGERRVEGVDADVNITDEFSRIKASVSKGKAFAVGNVFDEIALGLTVENQNLTVDRLSLRWGGSRVRMRAKVEHLSAPKEVVLSGNVDKIDWDAAARLVNDVRAAISTRAATAADDERPWLRTFKYSIPRGFPDTRGHVRVGEITHPNFYCKDLELMWSVRGVTPALDRLAGEARLSFGPGRVNDIAAVQSSNKFLNVVFLPFIYMHKMNNLSVFSGNTAFPKSLDFTKIDGEYGASKGVATIRYFHVDSPQLVAYTQGTADLGRETVDLNIMTRLTSYRSTLPEWWVDEAGRPAIGFRVKGDINKPELEPRFKKIGENEMEKKVDEARARAKKRFEALEKLQTL
ncbi:MAG: AsmA family protein [Elusimicrobia bacterium]|nr:AsmA family protein [Elusimicrobiota bacterium]